MRSTGAVRLTLVILAVLLALPATAAAAERPAPFFAAPCGFSHRAPDDPIVAPGRAGAAHLHDFFGNRSTGASSTYESLRAAGTSCRRSADRAAYWVPTLFAGQSAVRPRRAQIYYQGGGHRKASSVQAFPPGLRVIAGDARAAGPQPTSVVNWHCGADSGVRAQQAPPLCPEGRDLRMQVRFPNCWDGANLDSPDHRSHMAYTRRGACPSSHPVAVPRIVMNVRYPVGDGRGTALSSGPAHTAHADFFNAWEQGELERLVRVCIRGRRGNERICRPGARPPLPLAPSTGTVPYRGRVALGGDVGGGPGRPVRIQYRRRGAWESLAVVVTGPGGEFGFSFRAGSTSSYRALAPDGRATRVVRVHVRPRVATLVRRRGRVLTLHGRVTPMKRRLVFRVERRVGARWITAARREARTLRGRASAALSLLRAGTYRVRVLSRGDSRHAAGRSHERILAIR